MCHKHFKPCLCSERMGRGGVRLNQRLTLMSKLSNGSRSFHFFCLPRSYLGPAGSGSTSSPVLTGQAMNSSPLLCINKPSRSCLGTLVDRRTKHRPRHHLILEKIRPTYMDNPSCDAFQGLTHGLGMRDRKRSM